MYRILTINVGNIQSLTHICTEDIQRIITPNFSRYDPVLSFVDNFYGIGGSLMFITDLSFRGNLAGFEIFAAVADKFNALHKALDIEDSLFINDMVFDQFNIHDEVFSFEKTVKKHNLYELRKDLKHIGIKFPYIDIGEKYHELAKNIVNNYFDEIDPENTIDYDRYTNTIREIEDQLCQTTKLFSEGSNKKENVMKMLIFYVELNFLLLLI